jgi:8-oxo-dGTP pyrophosphatase MutT (NUDIX family)
MSRRSRRGWSTIIKSPRNDRLLAPAEFFALATARLSLDTPQELTDAHLVTRHGDHNVDAQVMASIAAMPSIRTAAVLVPIIARTEPTVLFTRRTAHLADHGGQIAFPGGKIEAIDASPAAAALREAEEEIALERRLVEPIGYLDVHITPTGYRIVPTLARVDERYLLRVNRDEVEEAFEVPLAFLMAPQNHKREKADWNGLITTVYVISFNDRKIWGATAGILRNLWERIYKA